MSQQEEKYLEAMKLSQDHYIDNMYHIEEIITCTGAMADDEP